MSQAALHSGMESRSHDPSHSQGDPASPGKVAIWLFLASEIMFFVAMLGTYIVLRSGSPHLFSEHAAALSKPLAGTNTLVLIFSSLTMALAVDKSQKGDRSMTILYLALTLLCAGGFMGIKAVEYSSKLSHYTIVAKDTKDNKFYCYDGHLHSETSAGEIVLEHAFRMPLPENETGFNVHLVSEEYIKSHDATTGAELKPDAIEAKHGETYTIQSENVNTRMNYNSSRNIFYSCYWTLTGVHGVHIIGGMIPLFFLMVHAMRGNLKPATTEHIGLYWHFVDLVWIFLFPLMYLI